jgi:ribosomal protein S18 acetylase RimI-like enzyme
MKRDFQIKEIDELEIPIIQDLTKRIWPQTYSHIISQSQIDYMLEMMYSTSSLEKQIRAGNKFFIVYDNTEPVGFTSYSKENVADTFKLQKLYVLPEKQDAGFGKALLHHVLADVKKNGGKHLILQVNRHNNKAIAFYERNGFIVELNADFDIGNGFQMNDYIMGILL